MITTPTPPPKAAPAPAPADARRPRPWRQRAASWLWWFTVGFFALWLACRIASDRTHWTQYVYWVPPEAALAAGTVLALLSRLIRGRKIARPRPHPARALALPALLLTALGWALVECRAWRYAAPPAAPEGTRIRILHWNPSDPALKNLADAVLAQKPDIAFLTDPPWGVDWNSLRDRIGGVDGPVLGHEEAESTPEAAGEESDPAGRPARPAASAIRFGYLAQLVVFSRYPVIRWGGTKLDIEGVNNRFFGIGPETRGPIYPGVALFAELDTTSVIGRPIIVWFVDMPSDVRVWRRTMMEDAARTLAGENAVCHIRGSRGQDVAQPGKRAFPPPDLIVGDFNTPRGSESLRRLVADMTHAYDQAGRGTCRTYPRWLPLTHIDHLFLAPWLRAATYGIENPGGGRHRMQLCEIVGAPAKAP